ncbi:MAG: sigma-54-dependent Fis family transcriptional regulator [Acidobacteria bacterium]|uniref:Sigma-54-dependent Fis family transcriptional regulator n=1 Tax=Candidatus Polarisedimenticola svalbardensis TaxID=2886004 RepID=A0A8J7CE50_9BACT|nr:sigma-54-dependent Fis family transcriptional regulator [Candidatus Polarisedimenticola svalbardensis]
MQKVDQAGRAGRVLVLDDEPVIQDVLRNLLEKSGYEVTVLGDAAAARKLLSEDGDWDVFLLDFMLPDEDGMEVLKFARKLHPELVVVMITAFGTVENAVSAMKLGAFHYLTKPFKNEEVRHLVAQAARTSSLRRENRDLRKALEEKYKFEKIIGKSRRMQELYRFIDQVASSTSTVLIQGESGTGKELVAQAIHRRSLRAAKPFLVVNSHSIPAELLEDNLFGHARGAFTGAVGAKRGLLELADGGTILFDEISTISGDVQAKLLRVMQEKEFLPIGALESRKVDVRILAATNENLRDLVGEGRFREDLYYRLAVISIDLPPLRRRVEDIPLLAEHFLARYIKENRKEVEGFTPDVMAVFMEYGWPGNVRELENVVERGVVLATGDRIEVDSLPADLFGPGRTPMVPALVEGVGLSQAVADFESALIRAALEQAGGVQKKAAEILGLKPTTLNEKIKRLGITH